MQYVPEDTEIVLQDWLKFCITGFYQEDCWYFPPIHNGFVGSSDLVSPMKSDKQPTEKATKLAATNVRMYKSIFMFRVRNLGDVGEKLDFSMNVTLVSSKLTKLVFHFLVPEMFKPASTMYMKPEAFSNL